MSIGDAQGNVVGDWFLEILPEDGPPFFERIASEGFRGTGNNRRYLTVGPGGQPYLMRVFDDGLHIYRR